MMKNFFYILLFIELALCSSLSWGASFQFGGLRLDAVKVTSSGSATQLTKSDYQVRVTTGSAADTQKLPDATTLQAGYWYWFDNESSGVLTISNSSSTALTTLSQNQSAFLVVTSTATSGGPWSVFTGGGSGSSSPGPYWVGYFNSSYTWSCTAGVSYGNCTNSAVGTFTQTKNSSFGTVSPAASNDAGVTFTAPFTGTIKATSIINGFSTTSSECNVQLYETTTATSLNTGSVSGAVNQTETLSGTVDVVSGTSYTVKIRAWCAGTSNFSISQGSGDSLRFLLEYKEVAGTTSAATGYTSSAWYDGNNGFGSTSTTLRRFINARDTTGSGTDWSFTDDTAAGSYVTILTAGTWDITYWDCSTAGHGNIAIMVNPTLPYTTVPLNGTYAGGRRGPPQDTGSAGQDGNTHFHGRLGVNDKVYFNGNGLDNTGCGANSGFHAQLVTK